MTPRYPIYIPSKGRAESRLTVRSLDALGLPYQVVVEPQEFDAYAAVINPDRLLVLPFSNLGLGSIPARNWIWDHAAARGVPRYWTMDDNLRGFYRLNRNLKTPCFTGAMLRAAEEFTARYENVAVSGMEYFMFASRKTKMAPFRLNTRVYSNMLLQTYLRPGYGRPYRWRGRYNEDTDLCLRFLKDGWATVLFHAFLVEKQQTMTMRGGNTDELYAGDGRRVMAESLAAQHPDVARVSFKWGRVQHHVDYSGFRKNPLGRRPGLRVPDAVNDYGMILQKLDEDSGAWTTIDTASLSVASDDIEPGDTAEDDAGGADVEAA